MEPVPASFLLQPPVFHPLGVGGTLGLAAAEWRTEPVHKVLPYITTIFGGVYHGKQIIVQGTVQNEAERFQVDFQCGCSAHPRADIAFHFNPRFSSSPHVICNSLEGERWQDEKKCSKLPLKGGDNFVLLFRFENSCVKVSVNGHHFMEYPHRLPMERVDTLGIFGDVLVKAIGFINSNPYTADKIEYPICQPFLLNSHSLTVPYACRLTEGLKPGQMITLRGLVNPEPKELLLILTTDTDLVPLKLSASFREQVVACSSFLSETWEEAKQLNLTFFPFYPERFFEILLLCEAKSFKIAINGLPLGEYSPLILDLKEVSRFQVSGDVQLYSAEC
ncbi:galectin-12 isoform X1 [Lissotriton helveticus]